MSCDRYRDAIVDHACGAGIAGDAAAHLESCADCQQTYELQARAMAGLDRELEAALAVQPSSRFVSETMARVQESKRTRHYGTWWLGAAAAAAVVLLTIGLLKVNKPRVEVTHERAVAQSTQVSSALETPQPGVVSVPDRHAPKEKVYKAPVATSAATRVEKTLPPTASSESAPPARTASELDVEVVVPSGRAEALSKYLAMVRRGALMPPPVVQSADADLAIPEPVITPLAVEPLNVAGMTTEINKE